MMEAAEGRGRRASHGVCGVGRHAVEIEGVGVGVGVRGFVGMIQFAVPLGNGHNAEWAAFKSAFDDSRGCMVVGDCVGWVRGKGGR